MAMVWSALVEISVTPDSPGTLAGTSVVVVVPSATPPLISCRRVGDLVTPSFTE
jgi:hypothetical protein